MTQITDPITLGHVERGVNTLKEEVRGIFSEETVDRYVRGPLASHSGSKAPQFVLIFVNRFAKARFGLLLNRRA
jgi:hypothetical protein